LTNNRKCDIIKKNEREVDKMTDFEKFKKQFEDCYNNTYAPEPKENFLKIEDDAIWLYGIEGDEEIVLLFDKDGRFKGWE
jgi:hypothetical protein